MSIDDEDLNPKRKIITIKRSDTLVERVTEEVSRPVLSRAQSGPGTPLKTLESSSKTSDSISAMSSVIKDLKRKQTLKKPKALDLDKDGNLRQKLAKKASLETSLDEKNLQEKPSLEMPSPKSPLKRSRTLPQNMNAKLSFAEFEQEERVSWSLHGLVGSVCGKTSLHIMISLRIIPNSTTLLPSIAQFYFLVQLDMRKFLTNTFVLEAW